MQSTENSSKQQQDASSAAVQHRVSADGSGIEVLQGDPSRARAFLVLALGTAGWAAVVLLLAQVCRTGTDRVRAPGPARPEDAVALLAGAAGLATAVWLALATLLTVLAVIGPTCRAGRAAAPVCLRLAPAGLRRVVLICTGLGLAAAAPAGAVPPPTRPAAVIATTDRSTAGLDPGWAAPSDTGPQPVSEATTRTGSAPAAAAELDPGWLPTPSEPAGAPWRGAPVSSAGSTRTGAGEGSGNPAAAPPAQAGASVRGRRQVGDTLVVRRGDCLWNIVARQLEPGAAAGRIAAVWPRWYAANRATIGPDPDALLPGQHLRRPGPATGSPGSGSTGPAGSPRALGTPGERP